MCVCVYLLVSLNISSALFFALLLFDLCFSICIYFVYSVFCCLFCSFVAWAIGFCHCYQQLNSSTLLRLFACTLRCECNLTVLFSLSLQDNSTERENPEKKVDSRKNLRSFTIPDYWGKIPIFAHIFFFSCCCLHPPSQRCDFCCFRVFLPMRASVWCIILSLTCIVKVWTAFECNLSRIAECTFISSIETFCCRCCCYCVCWKDRLLRCNAKSTELENDDFSADAAQKYTLYHWWFINIFCVPCFVCV